MASLKLKVLRPRPENHTAARALTAPVTFSMRASGTLSSSEPAALRSAGVPLNTTWAQTGCSFHAWMRSGRGPAAQSTAAVNSPFGLGSPSRS
jgi:hypothetical protein